MKNNLRKNTCRERAWKVMRNMQSFTLSEVCTIAEVPYSNISHWNQCLVAAGYIRQTGKKKQDGRPGFDKVFRLIKNTGPNPPVQKSIRFLYDPNTSEYWAADPEVMAQTVSVDVIPTELPTAPEPGIKPTVADRMAYKIRIHVKPGSFLDLVEKNRQKKQPSRKGGDHVA